MSSMFELTDEELVEKYGVACMKFFNDDGSYLDVEKLRTEILRRMKR